MSKAFRVAALALSIAATRAASAQDSESGDAERLFREGAVALRHGELDAACDKLQRSNSLEPAIGTLGLLALCHERQGKIATAVEEYRAVTSLARTANQPERADIAAARVKELAPRVGRLELELPSSGAELTIILNDHRLSPAELSAPLALDPGPVTIRASAEHYESWSGTAVIGSNGGTTKLAIPELERSEPARVAAPVPVPLPPPAKAPKLGPTPVQSSAKTEPRALTWVAWGAGAAGLGVGSFFGFRALASKRDSNEHCVGNECDADGVRLRSSALHEATAATVLIAAGALATGIGFYLYVSEPEAPRVAAQLTPAPGGGSLSLRGCF